MSYLALKRGYINKKKRIYTQIGAENDLSLYRFIILTLLSLRSKTVPVLR